jgi:hypothetical protein
MLFLSIGLLIVMMLSVFFINFKEKLNSVY